MLSALKKRLFSPDGMLLVNTCLAVAIILPTPLPKIIACGFWLALLLYNIKHTPFSSTKILYCLLSLLAICVILVNLYALFAILPFFFH